MSRYTFDVEPFEYSSNGRPIRGRYWQVGWNHPMWTYFAQLYSIERGDDLECWIVGAKPQYVTVEALEAEMGVRIPEEIRQQLIKDQQDSFSNPDLMVGPPR